ARGDALPEAAHLVVQALQVAVEAVVEATLVAVALRGLEGARHALVELTRQVAELVERGSVQGVRGVSVRARGAGVEVPRLAPLVTRRRVAAREGPEVLLPIAHAAVRLRDRHLVSRED